MAAASESAPVTAPRRASWRLKLGGIALIGSAAWVGRRSRTGTTITPSSSTPVNRCPTGRCWSRPDAFRRAAIMSFSRPAMIPLVRHFGANPKPFAKIAYGVPGDVVSRQGADVLVNGQAVGHLKPKTHQGEDLLPGPTGTIPQGASMPEARTRTGSTAAMPRSALSAATG
jgi:conjugal transfer pilin signal peptidase TrbI